MKICLTAFRYAIQDGRTAAAGRTSRFLKYLFRSELAFLFALSIRYLFRKTNPGQGRHKSTAKSVLRESTLSPETTNKLGRKGKRRKATW